MKTSVNCKNKIQQETLRWGIKVIPTPESISVKTVIMRRLCLVVTQEYSPAERQAELENNTSYKIEKVMFPNETTIIVTCGNQHVTMMRRKQFQTTKKGYSMSDALKSGSSAPTRIQPVQRVEEFASERANVLPKKGKGIIGGKATPKHNLKIVMLC